MLNIFSRGTQRPTIEFEKCSRKKKFINYSEIGLEQSHLQELRNCGNYIFCSICQIRRSYDITDDNSDGALPHLSAFKVYITQNQNVK